MDIFFALDYTTLLSFEGTVANRTLSYFHEGSFNIPLTVPLNASLVCICIYELHSVPKTLVEILWLITKLYHCDYLLFSFPADYMHNTDLHFKPVFLEFQCNSLNLVKP